MAINNYKSFLEVEDYSVTNEIFELLRDDEIDLLITSPKPKNSELPKYYDSEDYISHTDGQRSVFEKLYQIVKKIAISQKVKLVTKSQINEGRILDIGTGTGDFLLKSKEFGWNTYGTEPNEKARNIAQNKGLHLIISTSEIEDNFFDVITMWHVLEHVPDLKEQIVEVKRLLKPTGTIFIAVPNFNSYDARYYGKFWAAYDVPRHLWHFSKTAVKALFAKEDMRVDKILPLKFDAFYVSLLSEKFKNGKMNPIKAFLIGLRSNFHAKKNLEYSSHIYVIKNN